MKRMLVSVFVTLCVAVVPAFGHLCNNVFRAPGRVIVKPEKPVVTLEKTEELRVFVQNNYPAPLHNVRLTVRADGEGVHALVAPDALGELKAGERTAFKVRLTAAAGSAPKQLTLKFGFSADEINFSPVEEPSAQELRARLSSRPNFGDNVLAAETLARRCDPIGARWLIGFMTDDGVGRDFRGRAIRALGKAGDPKNAEALKGLLNARDGFLTGNALLALGCLKAEPETLNGFAQDRDEFVRACAWAGAALAGRREFLPQLREGLRSENVYVRIACGWGLAAQGEKEGLAALDEALSTKTAMQLIMAGDALTHLAERQE